MKRWLVVVALAGCGKHAPTDAKAIVGTAVVPPFGLDTLRRGMTLPEAAAAAGLEERRRNGDSILTKASGHADVEIQVPLDDGRVSDIVLELGAIDSPRPVIAAWGPATSANADGDPVWTTADWQATLHCGDHCRLHFVPYRPLDAARLGGTPALPAFVAPLRFGMSEEELTQHLLADHAPTELIGVSRSFVRGSGSGVRSITLRVEGDAVPVIEQAWGAGRTRWFDLASRTRARVELHRAMAGVSHADETEIIYEPYTPLAEFLAGSEAFAVGGTAADLAAYVATIPGAVVSGTRVELPPFDGSATSTIRYTVEDDQVLDATIELTAFDEARPQIVARWPGAIQDPADPQRLVLRAAGPRITATFDDQWISLRVGDGAP